MFEKDMNISLLLDFYGDILPERQRIVLEQYFDEDLSLAEISEQLNISRQGVHYSVKKGEEALFEFEEKLGLVRRFLSLKEEIDRIASQLEADCEKNTDELKISAANAIAQLRELKL